MDFQISLPSGHDVLLPGLLSLDQVYKFSFNVSFVTPSLKPPVGKRQNEREDSNSSCLCIQKLDKANKLVLPLDTLKLWLVITHPLLEMGLWCWQVLREKLKIL